MILITRNFAGSSKYEMVQFLFSCGRFGETVNVILSLQFHNPLSGRKSTRDDSVTFFVHLHPDVRSCLSNIINMYHILPGPSCDPSIPRSVLTLLGIPLTSLLVCLTFPEQTFCLKESS